MAASELDAMLLAAGLGTRLRPLTEQIPKALLPIYGVPLLDYHLDLLLAPRPDFALRRVTVNGHSLAALVRARLERHPRGKRLGFSFEEEILGTGGALAQAAGRLESDPFLVSNAKTLLADPPLGDALALHRAGGFAATLVLVRAAPWANVAVEGTRVAAVRRGRIDPGLWAFTGVHLVSQAALREIPIGVPHDIRDTYDRLAARGALGAYLWESAEADPFRAIATPGDYLEAHRVAAGASAPRYGLRVDEPFRERRIAPARGYGFIEASARLGAGCVVEESVVLARARVAPGARVTRSIVGPGAEATGDLRGTLLTTIGSREIG
jgi:mannose-1-phosphate guanylyltransferase